MSQAYLHKDNMEDVRERLENAITQSSVETLYDGEDCFITVAQKNYATGNKSEWSFCVDFGTNKVQMLEPVEDEEGFTSDNEVFRIIKNFLNGGSSREKRMNRPDYDAGEPIKITSFGNKIGSSNKTVIRQGPNLKTLDETPAEHIMKNLDAYKGYTRYDMEQLVLNPSGYTLYDGDNRNAVYKKDGAEDITLLFRNGELKDAKITSSYKSIKSSFDLFSGDFFNGKIKLSLEVCNTPLDSRSYKYTNNGKIYFYAVTINGKSTETPNVSIAYLPGGREPIYFNDDVARTNNLPNEVYVENTFSPEMGISLTINSNADFVYDYISSSESYRIKNLSVPEGGFLIKEYGRETPNGRAIFDYFKLVASNRGNDKVFLRMIVDYVARHMSRPCVAYIVVDTPNPIVSFGEEEADIFDIRAIVKATIQFKKGSLSKIASSFSRKPIKSSRTEYDNTSGEEVEISKEADSVASTIESTEDLLEFLQDYNVDLSSDNVYIENNRVITDSDGWTDDCSIAMYVQKVMDNFVKNTEIEDNNVKIYFVARDPDTKKYYGHEFRRKSEAVGPGDYRSYPDAKIGDVINKDCKIIDIRQSLISDKLENLIYLTDNIKKASYYDSASEVKREYPQAEVYQVSEGAITSAKKPIKSGINDTLIGKSDNGEYSIYLSDCKDANHGKDPHQEYMLAHNGQVTDTVRTDDPYATSVKEHWQDVFHIKGVNSSRKPIKSSKYIVEVGNDEIKFDNIEEANETFRQAVENNDVDTSIKIYVDEGYSNKHLKLMRSERGRLTSSCKPIKSSRTEYDNTSGEEVVDLFNKLCNEEVEFFNKNVNSSKKPIKSDFNPYYEKHPDTPVGYLLGGEADTITDDDKKAADEYGIFYEGYGTMDGTEKGHLFIGEYQKLKSYFEDYMGHSLADDYIYPYEDSFGEHILDRFEIEMTWVLPTEKDYQDVVNKLNEYVDKEYGREFGTGSIYHFNMYKGKGTNTDGYGHEYPNYVIFDTEGNLDLFSNDEIVQYIDNLLAEKGWYHEAVSGSDNFTIAIK